MLLLLLIRKRGRECVHLLIVRVLIRFCVASNASAAVVMTMAATST